MAELDAALTQAALDIIDSLGAPATFHLETRAYSAREQRVVRHVSTATRKIAPPSIRDSVNPDGNPTRTVRTSLAAKGLTFVPLEGMRVVFKGREWRVIAVSTVYSGDEVALYELEIE